MAEFLLEIGTEEIPAGWLPGLTEQLRRRFDEIAARELLAGEVPAEAWSTPRRLVLRAEVLPRQADREETVWGPALKVARDTQGAWTSAAHGFAKKNAVAADALGTGAKDLAKPGELYVFHLTRTAGRPAAEVLAGAIAALLRALQLPRRMSWDAWLDDGKGAFPFARPVRWMVAVLDGAVVPFAIRALVDGRPGEVVVAAGDVSYGHRFLPRGRGGEPVAAGSFAALRDGLRAANVVLDPAERETIIREQLGRAGALSGAEAHGLVAEWRDLVEFPTVLAGEVPAEFRTLPAEVLETVLVHHQKYAPVSEGGRVARFAALVNTDDAAAEQIVRGMQRVVVARLRDAAFFFAEDLKRPLADRVEDLSGVTFHRDLGSYRDKAERLAGLIGGPLDGPLGRAEDRAAAQEAARLAKADLTTLMVREFTELQGVMGALYLERQGAAPAVAGAVRWHYYPVSVDEGSAPTGVFADDTAARVFAAVALADKLDTLAGYFGLGLVPTGSSDPFGLRRAAQGALRVLLDFWPASAADDAPPPALRALLAAAVQGHGSRLKRPAADVQRDLEGFLVDRLRFVLVARGFAGDETDAVLAARDPDPLDDPRETLARLVALHRVRLEATADFEALAVAFKRARNILGAAPPDAVDPALFQEPAEKALHAAVAELSGRDGSYEARLRALAALRTPVDRFFDDVLVMAEDPRVRANRLGLLAQALSLFYRIADISKLGG